METNPEHAAGPDPHGRGAGTGTSHRSRARRPVETAFSAHFLDRAHRRQQAPAAGESLADTPLARQAHWSGPWEVVPVPSGDSLVHVVARKGEAPSDPEEAVGPRLSFLRRQDALLAAASLASVAAPSHLSLSPGKKKGCLGHPIHEGTRHLGHASADVQGVGEDFLVAFHTVRCLAADPEAAALLIEALDPETLGILGRAIMRRLG